MFLMKVLFADTEYYHYVLKNEYVPHITLKQIAYLARYNRTS